MKLRINKFKLALTYNLIGNSIFLLRYNLSFLRLFKQGNSIFNKRIQAKEKILNNLNSEEILKIPFGKNIVIPLSNTQVDVINLYKNLKVTEAIDQINKNFKLKDLSAKKISIENIVWTYILINILISSYLIKESSHVNNILLKHIENILLNSENLDFKQRDILVEIYFECLLDYYFANFYKEKSFVQLLSYFSLINFYIKKTNNMKLNAKMNYYFFRIMCFTQQFNSSLIHLNKINFNDEFNFPAKLEIFKHFTDIYNDCGNYILSKRIYKRISKVIEFNDKIYYDSIKLKNYFSYGNSKQVINYFILNEIYEKNFIKTDFFSILLKFKKSIMNTTLSFIYHKRFLTDSYFKETILNINLAEERLIYLKNIYNSICNLNEKLVHKNSFLASEYLNLKDSNSPFLSLYFNDLLFYCFFLTHNENFMKSSLKKYSYISDELDRNENIILKLNLCVYELKKAVNNKNLLEVYSQYKNLYITHLNYFGNSKIELLNEINLFLYRKGYSEVPANRGNILKSKRTIN